MSYINNKNNGDKSGDPWVIRAVKRDQLAWIKDLKGTSISDPYSLSKLDTAGKPVQENTQGVGIYIVKQNKTIRT